MIIDMLKGGINDETIMLVIAFLFAILISISVHEFAHGYVAHKLGDDTAKRLGRLTLNPVAHLDIFGTIAFLVFGFGWAKPVPINPVKFKEYRKGIFLTSVAGIVANVFLAFFSAGAYVLSLRLVAIASGQVWVFATKFLYLFFYELMYINLGLALFNFLPIAPLDGFNIIFSLTKEGNRVVEFLKRYGSYILIGLLLFMSFIEPMLTFLNGSSLLFYVANLIAEPMQMFWLVSIFNLWVV